MFCISTSQFWLKIFYWISKLKIASIKQVPGKKHNYNILCTKQWNNILWKFKEVLQLFFQRIIYTLLGMKEILKCSYFTVSSFSFLSFSGNVGRNFYKQMMLITWNTIKSLTLAQYQYYYFFKYLIIHMYIHFIYWNNIKIKEQNHYQRLCENMSLEWLVKCLWNSTVNWSDIMISNHHAVHP